MFTVKVSDISYQNPRNKQLDSTASQDDWAIEKRDAPFEFISVHCNCVKLNEVTSVDNIAESFLQGGGSIVQEKLTIKGVASLISCKDSQGHIFSFIEQEL